MGSKQFPFQGRIDLISFGEWNWKSKSLAVIFAVRKDRKIYLQVGEKAIFLQWIPLVSNFLALICFHLENPVKIIRLED